MVVDPRHPLFGMTLRLVGITRKQYQGTCCVVWLIPGVERLVPLAATDRSPESIALYALPLSLPSVRQLTATWKRIVSQRMEGTRDGSSGNTPGFGQTPNSGYTGKAMVSEQQHADTCGRDLANPEFNAAAECPGYAGARVLPPGPSRPPRCDGGGDGP
jgi:hypothetical protein